VSNFLRNNHKDEVSQSTNFDQWRNSLPLIHKSSLNESSIHYQDSGDYFKINPIDIHYEKTLQTDKTFNITRIKEEFNKDNYFDKVGNLRTL